MAQVPSTGISIRVKFEGYSEVSTVGSGIEGGGGGSAQWVRVGWGGKSASGRV